MCINTTFKRQNIVYSLVLILMMVSTSQAQCAMCRAVLQTEESGVPAEADNDGIVYLMAFPYLLVLFGGMVIYRIMKSKKAPTQS